MKIIYDPEVDVLRIRFSDVSIEESDEEKPDVILDYDQVGNVVGLEILTASKRVTNPRALEYAVTSRLILPWTEKTAKESQLQTLYACCYTAMTYGANRNDGTIYSISHCSMTTCVKRLQLAPDFGRLLGTPRKVNFFRR